MMKIMKTSRGAAFYAWLKATAARRGIEWPQGDPDPVIPDNCFDPMTCIRVRSWLDPQTFSWCFQNYRLYELVPGKEGDTHAWHTD